MKIAVNDKIYLSEVNIDDFKSYMNYFNDENVHRFLMSRILPYNKNLFDGYLSINKSFKERHGRPNAYGIRKDSGELIGCIDIISLNGHKAMIAYWLGKEFWGKGIISNTLKVFINYMFKEYGVVKISADAVVENIGSQKVLERCGFELEGTLVKHYKRGHDYFDTKLYASVKY